MDPTVTRVTRMIFLFGAESNNTYELGEELRVRVRWIRSAANRDVNASLAHNAVGTDGARKVDGSVTSAPQVSLGGRYFVFSNPPADGAQGLRLMIDLFGEQANTSPCSPASATWGSSAESTSDKADCTPAGTRNYSRQGSLPPGPESRGRSRSR